jgi:hypothetical protein
MIPKKIKPTKTGRWYTRSVAATTAVSKGDREVRLRTSNIVLPWLLKKRDPRLKISSRANLKGVNKIGGIITKEFHEKNMMEPKIHIGAKVGKFLLHHRKLNIPRGASTAIRTTKK